MRAAAEDRWIKLFEPRPDARLRLFCFAYAGGGASIYRLWPADLPAAVEVRAVQLPGREEFIDALRRFSGTPEEVLQNRELMELIEPLLRADFSVSETYAYQPDPERLAVPLTALGGVEDPEEAPEHQAPWSEETTGPFQQHLIPGGHFFLDERRREVLAIVAKELQRYL